MKKMLACSGLLILAAALFACAVPTREVLLDIDRQRLDEAWEKAYKTAGTLGYVPGQYDIENRKIHFKRKDQETMTLPMDLRIIMEMDLSDEERPVLKMVGTDKDTARDYDQVEADMKKIADYVHRCCGVYENAQETDETPEADDGAGTQDEAPVEQ